MKEIPAGLKSHLFAMYYGQEIMKWIYPQPPENAAFKTNITGSIIEAYHHECYLELRSLSSITDDEAIEVAKIMGLYEPIIDSSGYDGIILKQGNQFTCQLYFDGEIYCDINGTNIEYIYAYQYLQQQGFALSVFYKGVLYPVEQLTDWGFIKIQE